VIVQDPQQVEMGFDAGTFVVGELRRDFSFWSVVLTIVMGQKRRPLGRP